MVKEYGVDGDNTLGIEEFKAVDGLHATGVVRCAARIKVITRVVKTTAHTCTLIPHTCASHLVFQETKQRTEITATAAQGSIHPYARTHGIIIKSRFIEAAIEIPRPTQ